MEKIGFSKFVSLGNKAHLDESDFVEAFGRDSDSTFILLYIESVVDGRKFMDACRRVVKNKPIFAVKMWAMCTCLWAFTIRGPTRSGWPIRMPLE